MHNLSYLLPLVLLSALLQVWRDCHSCLCHSGHHAENELRKRREERGERERERGGGGGEREIEININNMIFYKQHTAVLIGEERRQEK